MAKGGRGLVAVVVGAVLVAVGLALVYLLIIGPRREASSMQKEIEALAPRWAEVRACFYGAEPRSNDPVEALVLHELSTPGFETQIAVCEETLRAARRADGPSSGNNKVEDAWLELRKARRALGSSLAIRLQVPRPRPVAVLRENLAKAMVASEAAYAALREAAGLAADPLAGAPVKAAELEPITVGDKPAEQVWIEANAVLAARVDAKQPTFQIHGDGETSEPLRAGPAQLIGHGGRWVVEIAAADSGRGAALVATELDPPATGGEPQRVEIAKVDAETVITGALDNGRGARLVVTFDPAGRALVAHRSGDGGQSWTRETLVSELDSRPTSEIYPVQERVIVGVYGVRYEIGGGGLAAAERPAYATACLAPGASWWMSDRGLAAGAPGEALSPVSGSEDMPWRANACTDQQALGVAPVDPDIELPAHKLRLCGRDRCPISASLPRARGANLAAVIGPLGGPAVAFELDGVALLWAGAEGGSGLTPRAWMRLPDGHEMVGLVEWSGQVRAVIKSEDGWALATFRQPR